MHTTDSTTGSTRRIGRTLRRVSVGAAVIGLALAGNAAIGASDDNGRDGSTVPGAPTDAPAPVVDDTATRDAGASPGRASASADPSATVAPTDNGRGGADPAVGPLPVTAERATTTSADSGAVDADSGVMPAPDAGASRAASAPEAPTDQDVPGAATASTPGDDLPSLDQDG